MRNKKGFTLIELLAVIVILAIIMVIAVPKILDLIEESRQSAVLESGRLYVDTVNKYMSFNEMDSVKYPFEKSSDNNYTVDDLKEYVKMKGSYPSSGDLTITKKVTYADLCINGYNVLYENSNYSLTSDAKCGNAVASNEEVETVIEDKLACDLEYDETINTYYVDSVGDLYKLSSLVNSGTNFSGKIVSLRNNLDMSETLPNTTECSGLEFKPIGTLSNPFKGTFSGGAKTIKNITFNLPDQDYVGLFGNISGATIQGFNVENENITGLNNVGGISGSESGATIREIMLKNVNISGNDGVGGVVGFRHEGSVSNIIVKSANVTATSTGGVLWASQTSGASSYAGSTSNSIIERADVTASSIKQGGWGWSNIYWTNNYKMNGELDTTYSVTEDKIQDINCLESAYLDTWIGGDDDSSGYYYDYDNNGKIVIKDVSKNPITFTLEGRGTADDPYIIDSYQHYKEATTKVDQASIVFKLTNDIDFSNNKFYMMGSSQNTFIGTFNGGAKTLSNISISYGYSNIGIFGYITSATIQGFNVENENITGLNNVGGISGSESGATIREIMLKNVNISGNDGVGGVVGFRHEGSISNIIVKSANVTATSTGGVLWASQTSGASSYAGSTSNSIIERADVTASSIKQGGWGWSNIYWSTQYLTNNSPVSGGFDVSYIDDLDYYSGKVETGNDSDDTGYYYDKVNGIIKVVAVN